MAYEDYEMVLIKSFGEEVDRGTIRPDNIDLQGNNPKTKYYRYINAITSIKPREYLTSEFSTLDSKNIFEIAVTIIVSIFGEKSIPYILDYFKILVPSGAKEVLNGVSLTIEDTRDGSLIEQVEIPDFETSSNIVTIVHEFTHYYLNKIGVNYNKKRYYEEIMAILCEKRAAQIVNTNTGEQDFYDKITEHRLETISWHYGTHLKDINELINVLNKLEKKAKTDLSARMKLESFRMTMPIIRTSKGISALKGYYQNLADGYGIGFLYSESLLSKYLDDEHTFHLQVDKMTSKEQSLQDLLDYYGINARSNEVYNRVNTRLEEIKQFKKR